MDERLRFRQPTLVDLLDRLLDRGVFLEADLVIVVADVPLVAARLRAALSSVETMVRYGYLEEGLLEPAHRIEKEGTA